MKKQIFLMMSLIAILAVNCFAADKIIKLPAPNRKGGKPLMAALDERQSKRNISAAPLNRQELSDLFFAATGVTRKNGKLTIPTARDARSMILFAAMPDGLYRYNPEAHQLELEQPRDFREFTGTQKKMHTTAPVVLIYVSDNERMKRVNIPESGFTKYGAFHAGSMSQNVYLYAASANLSTVVCGLVEIDKLAIEMKLPESHRIQFTQPIGRK